MATCVRKLLFHWTSFALPGCQATI
jgi:hypothetical protein